MAINLPDNFVKEYSSNLQILTQLMGNKFAGKCREETINGEEAYYDQLSETVASVRDPSVSQFPDSPVSSITHSRRKVTATAYDNGLFIDRIEKVQTLVDPASPYANQQVIALNRKRDQEFFKGALGDAATGKTGGGTAPLTDCPIVASDAGGEGMNLDKLVNALYELEATGVDVTNPATKPYLVWSPRQKNELLTNTKVTSADYASVKALVTGQINTFYGFEFITSTLVPYANTAGTGVNLDWSATTDAPVDTDVTSKRMCFAYTRDNVLMATNPDITTRATERPDKSYDWYAYAVARFGAVRMQEKNLVTIPCLETGSITEPA